MNLNFTLILQIVSFLALLGFLTKFLYKPFIKYLDDRSKDIKKLIEGTEGDRKKAESYLRDSKEELERTKEKIFNLKDTTAREMDTEKIKTIDETKKEAASILKTAELDIKKEIEKAKSDAKKDIASISIYMAKKILGREIKEKDHEKLIKESLEGIKDEG